MKKSLLALALLGAFAGAASAQSSVTIYGILDAGLGKGNGGTATNPGALGTNKAYQLIQSKTSRLGFRGNEDLGGGLSAQFHIEHRFNPDTGTINSPGSATSTSQFWNGLSYVQLTSAAAGKVYLGRYYTPTFLLANRVDPFGWDGVGQVGSNQYANFLNPDTVSGLAGDVGVRTSNTIGYSSPSFGGFVVNGAFSLSEATQKGRDISLTATYGAGPIFAGVGYERVSKGTFNKQGLINAAVSYDLGVAKLLGYYGRSKTGINGVNTNHAWMFGALVPVGPGTIKAAYSRVDPRFANNTRQKLSLGYEYNLSKRTLIYADAGLAREDLRTKNNAFAFGVRHAF